MRFGEPSSLLRSEIFSSSPFSSNHNLVRMALFPFPLQVVVEDRI